MLGVMSQIVKPGPNTASYPTPGDTDGIKLWMAGAAGAAALLATQNAYENFKTGPFASWVMNFEAGRADEPPPGAPAGFDALMSDDGLDYQLIPSTAPSGPPPTYPKKNIIQPGPIMRPSTGPVALLFGEIGKPMTQKDGTVWVRLS